MARKRFAWDLISNFCWDCIFLSFFFLPIFTCNFWEVLKPLDAHLNLISGFSGSITVSNITVCACYRINSVFPLFLWSHGIELGGMKSYASLPLLVFQDEAASQDHISKSSFEGCPYSPSWLSSSLLISSQSICPIDKGVEMELNRCFRKQPQGAAERRERLNLTWNKKTQFFIKQVCEWPPTQMHMLIQCLKQPFMFSELQMGYLHFFLA